MTVWAQRGVGEVETGSKEVDEGWGPATRRVTLVLGLRLLELDRIEVLSVSKGQTRQT